MRHSNAISANKYENASLLRMPLSHMTSFVLEKSIRIGVTSLRMTGVRIMSLACQSTVGV